MSDNNNITGQAGSAKSIFQAYCSSEGQKISDPVINFPLRLLKLNMPCIAEHAKPCRALLTNSSLFSPCPTLHFQAGNSLPVKTGELQLAHWGGRQDR